MKRKKLNIESFSYYGAEIRYIGALPDENTVFLSGGKSMGREGIVAMYRSSLEAAANEWSVSYITGLQYSEAVERGLYERDKGALFAFVPMGIKCASLSLISRCLVTGGGVISTVNDDSVFSLEALSSCRSLAHSLSRATIIGNENLSSIPYSIMSALDEGRDVGVLESALNGKGVRNLVREGAPIVRSFSDFLYTPRYISFPYSKGKYGIMGERFGLLDIERHEK